MKVNHVAQKRKRLQALISRKSIRNTLFVTWRTGWIENVGPGSWDGGVLPKEMAHAVENLMKEEDELLFQEALRSLDSPPCK